MHPKLFLFLGGLAVGIAVGVLVSQLVSDGASSNTPDPEIAQLREQIARGDAHIRDLVQAMEERAEEHRQKLLALEADLNAAREATPDSDGPPAALKPEEVQPAETGVPTMEEMEAALKEFGSSLTDLIMGGDVEKQRAKLRALFARAGPDEVAAILEKYKDSSDIMQKMLMAHALAQSGNRQALDALIGIVKDRELGFLDRRFASHGLAFLDDESLKPLLLEVARGDPDRGTRANSAFGVARQGDDEGMKLYAKITDEAFREKDPMAINYLGGFMLLGEKGLPHVRERLGTYTEPQSRVMLIELVKGHKDRESLPTLQRIARDAEEDKSVREAAEQAIRIIEDQRD